MDQCGSGFISVQPCSWVVSGFYGPTYLPMVPVAGGQFMPSQIFTGGGGGPVDPGSPGTPGTTSPTSPTGNPYTPYIPNPGRPNVTGPTTGIGNPNTPTVPPIRPPNPIGPSDPIGDPNAPRDRPTRPPGTPDLIHPADPPLSGYTPNPGNPFVGPGDIGSQVTPVGGVVVNEE